MYRFEIEQQKRREKVEQNKGLLLEQIEAKKKIDLQNAKEDYEKDKQHVDEVVNRIMREEEALQKERVAKQERTRKLIAEYQNQWQSEKEQQKQHDLEQDEKIRQYQVHLLWGFCDIIINIVILIHTLSIFCLFVCF